MMAWKNILTLVLLVAGLGALIYSYSTEAAPDAPPPPAEAAGLSGREDFAELSFSYLLSWHDPRMPVGIKKEGEKCILTLHDCSWDDDDARQQSFEMTRKDREALEELLAKCKVRKWDGFAGNDMTALDGYMFNLSVTFADGKRISAHGSNDAPRGFGEFQAGFMEILEHYAPLH